MLKRILRASFLSLLLAPAVGAQAAPKPNRVLQLDGDATTRIGFALPVASAVELAIYNLLGQRLVTLVDGWSAAGDYRVVWDGRDGAGRPLGTGAYLAVLRVGDTRLTRKLTLLQ